MIIKLYTVEELKEILKLSSFTIRKKIREGEIVAYKVGKKYLIKEVDLKNYIFDLTEGSNKSYNSNVKKKSENNKIGSSNIDRQNRF